MYRCFGCDTPPSLGHVNGCVMAAMTADAERVAESRRALYSHPDVRRPSNYLDPWGWEDSPVKVDIQSGLKVNAREAIAA
jgi:hypothetical protein